MTRPTWDQTWMGVARGIADRSDCGVRRVACVIASFENDAHWVGYNGPPAGYRSPLGPPVGSGCQNYCQQGAGAARGHMEPQEWPCVSIHAEVNCLIKSDPALRRGGSAYVTAAPCWKCALALANSGVLRLYCPPWEDGRRALGERVKNVWDGLGLDLIHPGEGF